MDSQASKTSRRIGNKSQEQLTKDEKQDKRPVDQVGIMDLRRKFAEMRRLVSTLASIDRFYDFDQIPYVNLGMIHSFYAFNGVPLRSKTASRPRTYAVAQDVGRERSKSWIRRMINGFGRRLYEAFVISYQGLLASIYLIWYLTKVNECSSYR